MLPRRCSSVGTNCVFGVSPTRELVMNPHVRVVVAAGLLLFAAAGRVAGQGASTGAISGVVVDSERAVVPGADVIVTNKATGETFNAVTSGEGVFSVPSLI